MSQWENGKVVFADKMHPVGDPVERVVLEDGPALGKSAGREQTVLLVFYQRTTQGLNFGLRVQNAKLVVSENMGEFTTGDTILEVGSSKRTTMPVGNDPEEYYAAVNDSILYHNSVVVVLSRTF